MTLTPTLNGSGKLVLPLQELNDELDLLRDQASNSTPEFNTIADAQTGLPVGATLFRVLGYHVLGDGGKALWRLVGSEPSHGAKIEINSNWYELVPEWPMYPETAGANMLDQTHDDQPAFKALLDLAGTSDTGPITVGNGCYIRMRPSPIPTTVSTEPGFNAIPSNNGYTFGSPLVISANEDYVARTVIRGPGDQSATIMPLHGNRKGAVPAWATLTNYQVGDEVRSDGKLYQAVSAGASGASAPNHTTGNVSDGGVTWSYVSEALIEITVTNGTGARNARGAMLDGFRVRWGGIRLGIDEYLRLNNLQFHQSIPSSLLVDNQGQPPSLITNCHFLEIDGRYVEIESGGGSLKLRNCLVGENGGGTRVRTGRLVLENCDEFGLRPVQTFSNSVPNTTLTETTVGRVVHDVGTTASLTIDGGRHGYTGAFDTFIYTSNINANNIRVVGDAEIELLPDTRFIVFGNQQTSKGYRTHEAKSLVRFQGDGELFMSTQAANQAQQRVHNSDFSGLVVVQLDSATVTSENVFDARYNNRVQGMIWHSVSTH